MAIHNARLKVLNDCGKRDGRYVLYWMQQSQRAQMNHALEHALYLANSEGLPLLVGFGIMDDYPEANRRHYAFMLEGLKEVASDLRDRGIGFVMRHGHPVDVARELSRDAALVVCDRGYTRHQHAWREDLASAADCRVEQVEADVVVPIDEVSGKAEYAARTIRPRIHKKLGTFMEDVSAGKVEHDSLKLKLSADMDARRGVELLDKLKLDERTKEVKRLHGGTSEARKRLSSFINARLESYAERRSEPSAYIVSYLSPYLHFGQISPVEVALKIQKTSKGKKEDRDGFLEELIVRRELSMNSIFHRRDDYDSYQGLPEWARVTLGKHKDDQRMHTYSKKELEAAQTHDPYWNASMREMVHTGYMHNYMRMYWGKKIIEWTSTPETAFRWTLELNNKYFLDGRDPNSFANVAWCFGLHDRAWTERDVFGKIRYMNDRGLERKFDMKAYCDAVDELVEKEKR